MKIAEGHLKNTLSLVLRATAPITMAVVDTVVVSQLSSVVHQCMITHAYSRLS